MPFTSREIMCNGHRFVKSTLFQSPGYLADLSPYINAVISSRLLATPMQITANAIKPLGPLATSILPARATNYILSGTFTCEYCLHQVSQDSYDDGRICPSLQMETYSIHDDNFILADRLLEAQEKYVNERTQQSNEESPTSSRTNEPNFYKDILFIMKICPEIGLHAQSFACIDCDKEIDLDSSRLCNYDGRYYCFQCHSGSDYVPIPARVLRNWDFTPRSVSKSSLQKICFIRTKPILFNLSQINPMLYGFIDRLVEIKHIRERLQSMLKYLDVCGQPERPNLSSVPRHFLESDLLNFYTLNDLIDLNQVYDLLNQLQKTLEYHIIRQCESCRGKGYYCELCKDSSDVLYPFSKNGATCSKCQTVYHKNCFHRKKRNCPRCVRISAKKSSSSVSTTTEDDRELSSDLESSTSTSGKMGNTF